MPWQTQQNSKVHFDMPNIAFGLIWCHLQTFYNAYGFKMRVSTWCSPLRDQLFLLEHIKQKNLYLHFLKEVSHTFPCKTFKANGFKISSSYLQGPWLCVYLVKIIFANLFYYSAYFCYYLWVLLQFLILFIGLIVLFRLTFTFIYSIFSKKFSVSAK